MNYMITIAETPESFADRMGPNAESYWAGWTAYSQAVAQAGIFVSGAGLMGPETATTVRFSGDSRQIEDGPFIDSKEQVGGFFVIDVPDLDTALSWAKRLPMTKGGSAEVRPTMPPPPQ
jgi:hypothetical protein